MTSQAGRGEAPEVSVIIPTRNRRRLLEIALSSAFAQRDVSLEVIVIDDGSTDDTQRYLSSIQDDRLRVLHQDPRGGVSAARNRGIDLAQGTWLAFLDDDDKWLPGRLRATIDEAAQANADFAYNDIVVVDANGRPIELAVAPEPEELEEALRMAGTIIGPSAVIATADLVRRVGGFDTGLAYLADWDLWLRFVGVGRAAHCSRPLIEYRQHPGSMLMDRDCDIHAEIARLHERHPEIELEALMLTRWVIRRCREEGERLRASRLYLHEARKYRAPSLILRAGIVLLGEGPMRFARRLRHRLIRRGVLSGQSMKEKEARWLAGSRSSRS